MFHAGISVFIKKGNKRKKEKKDFPLQNVLIIEKSNSSLIENSTLFFFFFLDNMIFNKSLHK